MSLPFFFFCITYCFLDCYWIHIMGFLRSTNNLIENESFKGKHYPPWLRLLSSNFHLISQVTSDTNDVIKSPGTTGEFNWKHQPKKHPYCTYKPCPKSLKSLSPGIKFLSKNGFCIHISVYSYKCCSWETCMQVRKQQLELDIEQQTGSK